MIHESEVPASDGVPVTLVCLASPLFMDTISEIGGWELVSEPEQKFCLERIRASLQLRYQSELIHPDRHPTPAPDLHSRSIT